LGIHTLNPCAAGCQLALGCHCPGLSNPRKCELVAEGAAGWADLMRADATTGDCPDRTPPAAEWRGAPAIPANPRRGECRYLGAGLVGGDGRPILRACDSCSGKTWFKVFACEHPAHAGDPTTTYPACDACGDYDSREPAAGPDPRAL